jgi:hypothetical protein
MLKKMEPLDDRQTSYLEFRALIDGKEEANLNNFPSELLNEIKLELEKKFAHAIVPTCDGKILVVLWNQQKPGKRSSLIVIAF